MIHRQPMSLLFNILHNTTTTANPVDFGHAMIFSFFFHFWCTRIMPPSTPHSTESTTTTPPRHHKNIDERTNGRFDAQKKTSIMGWKTLSAKKLILDFYTIKSVLTYIITSSKRVSLMVLCVFFLCFWKYTFKIIIDC